MRPVAQRPPVAKLQRGKVTVAKVEEDKKQTVSKDNDEHDWETRGEGSEIIGITQEKIIHANW